MKNNWKTRWGITLVAALCLSATSNGLADEPIRLWDKAAPGTETWDLKERTFEITVPEFGKLLLVTDITVPTLTTVRPDPAVANGTAVIVCPGGGFKFLNWESEGMEVARWLASRGVTAFVLKYRVRMIDDDAPVAQKTEQKTFEDALKAAEAKISIARADAVQAIRHLRDNADKYGIARDRIGLLGFSAGAMTTVSVALKSDAGDRPNFAASVYGAMEDAAVPTDAPPLFIIHTQADALVPAAQATKMFNAWTAAKQPTELHLYQVGSHGFGMRKVGAPVDGWTEAFEEWLRAGKFLDAPASNPTPDVSKATDTSACVGTWNLVYDPGNGEHKAVMAVTADGANLKATFKDGNRMIVVREIRLKDQTLTFTTVSDHDGDKTIAEFEGRIEGDSVKGGATWNHQGSSGSIAFAGKRSQEKSSEPVSVTAVSGKPSLLLGNFDVAPLGYQIEEFFLSGKATSYKPKIAITSDGKWDVEPENTEPYTTRLVVARPTDPTKFSGTVVVEWLNVTAGFDMPVEWNVAHREIMRRGHAYLAVSAQQVGVEGKPGPSTPGQQVGAVKKVDPKRYEQLRHPGDQFSFQIFSQAGSLAKESKSGGILGTLVPQRVIAAGESQSAMFLTTYVTAVDPLAKVYDGFLIHSRFGNAAPLHGQGMLLGPKGVKLRPDLRVPVLTVVTENDVLGWPPIDGYLGARQEETNHHRIWEIAGTAHADNYTFTVGFIDSGLLPIDQLAKAYAPTKETFGGKLDHPVNFGPQHHYVVQAALSQLDRWVRTGQEPRKAPALEVTASNPKKLITDELGLAKGGVRTPWVDVPTAILSGTGNSGGPLAGMVGLGKPFDAETMKRLYPDGKDGYLRKFEAALDEAIKSGFILPDDKSEILGIAAASFTSGQ